MELWTGIYLYCRQRCKYHHSNHSRHYGIHRLLGHGEPWRLWMCFHWWPNLPPQTPTHTLPNWQQAVTSSWSRHPLPFSAMLEILLLGANNSVGNTGKGYEWWRWKCRVPMAFFVMQCTVSIVALLCYLACVLVIWKQSCSFNYVWDRVVAWRPVLAVVVLEVHYLLWWVFWYYFWH